MQPTTSNILFTSLAVLLSSLTARTSMRVGGRRVANQWCTISSRYRIRDMGASSWVVVNLTLRRVF
jgi:hypothetical protein